ncbi:MAG: 23S rRNA (adenine(2503)-C(2))-methyltransferase RlmN [Bacteroidota bacterium]|nr:23S rRNA (adenine(2503)-C(2))-methyltransferase RlmN [Bacteroidota bacterium]
MSKNAKIDIRTLSLSELKETFVKQGEKAFRGQQVYEWLWKKSCTSFAGMKNISAETRAWLAENFVINSIETVDKQISNDGTIKSGFTLHDGFMVEGVLIPADERMTACVSSQVGCSLTCKFCATGKMNRERNLSAGEIYDQVVAIKNWAQEHYGKPLTNIVFMGMGEPLLNYANVLAGIEKITSPEGLGMAADRITVSTAGIAKMIQKLADDKVRFNLALSLHAANDLKRNMIMPINESNSLASVGSALKYFHQQTKKRVTFEYIAFKDFNESIQDAKELLAFCKQFPAKVNVIEYNPTGDGAFEKADSDKIDKFCAFLEKNGVVAKVRRSRGKDIDAACGQLANKKHEDALI